MDQSPFASIESAQEFVELLQEAVEEARRDIDSQVQVSDAKRDARRREALLLVAHNLSQLSNHVGRSRRLLNDLRSLRRLLLDERSLAAGEPEQPERTLSAGAAD